MRIITIRDETLRDGLQQSDINITIEERIMLSNLIAKVIDTKNSKFRNQIDLGMPEVSQKLLDTVQKIASLLNRKYKGIDFMVTGRALPKSIDLMGLSLKNVDDGRKIIAPFIGISRSHREKLNLSKSEVLEKIEFSVKYTKKYTDRIQFPLEGGFYAYLEERDYVYKIFNLLERLEVEAVPFCDTVGIALPFSTPHSISYGDVINDLHLKFPKIKLSVHCHNDLGLAIANSLDGLLKGAEIVDGTLFGIGERAGNTSLQTLLVAINEKGEHLGFIAKVNLSEIYEVSKIAQKVLKVVIPPNTPVIGENAFSHASGIHQDGTLKNEDIYHPYKPQKVGISNYSIKLNQYSGKSGIRYLLKNKFKISLNEEQLFKVVKEFKEMSFGKKEPETILLNITKKYR